MSSNSFSPCHDHEAAAKKRRRWWSASCRAKKIAKGRFDTLAGIQIGSLQICPHFGRNMTRNNYHILLNFIERVLPKRYTLPKDNIITPNLNLTLVKKFCISHIH
ncbi:uncharacterized protein LOC134221327 [Armigeres subalbatus]|uniref:uncharacterized protein LOC134221327 n=1 Tax=Armigeres subalbatus TaxID=124917 RepID=UPI002ED04F4C